MIVTYLYFISFCPESGISEADFNNLNPQSQEIIDLYLNGKLADFATYDVKTQELIKKAICKQVEYYDSYGLSVGFAEEERGFTVGKVSVHDMNRSSQTGLIKTYLSPIAIAYLEQTGLAIRVVGVL